jgi:hypothetical protein
MVGVEEGDVQMTDSSKNEFVNLRDPSLDKDETERGV